MATETIFQHPLAVDFIYPFLLIWTLVFAILRKTKLLGDNPQIDSVVAFVVGFIFVGVFSPEIDIVHNLIWFLIIAIVITFVGLLLWGFISGKSMDEAILPDKNWVKGTVIGIIIIALIAAVFWASGTSSSAYDFLFNQTWSNSFWTNVIVIVIVAGALALVISQSKSGGD